MLGGENFDEAPRSVNCLWASPVSRAPSGFPVLWTKTGHMPWVLCLIQDTGIACGEFLSMPVTERILANTPRGIGMPWCRMTIATSRTFYRAWPRPPNNSRSVGLMTLGVWIRRCGSEKAKSVGSITTKRAFASRHDQQNTTGGRDRPAAGMTRSNFRNPGFTVWCRLTVKTPPPAKSLDQAFSQFMSPPDNHEPGI